MFKYSHILRSWRLALQHRNLGDTVQPRKPDKGSFKDFRWEETDWNRFGREREERNWMQWVHTIRSRSSAV